MNYLKFWQRAYQWTITWGGMPCFVWLKAAEAYSQNKYQAAADLYEVGLKKYPKHSARHCAMMDLSYCYFKLGDFPAAINILNSILKSSPNSKSAYLRLANIYNWIGNDQEAMWLLRSAVQNFGSDIQLIHVYISSMLEAEPPSFVLKEAEELLSSIKTVPKPLQDAHQASHLILDYLNGEEKNLNDLIKISKQPGAPIAVSHLLAKVLIKDGNFDKARENLQQALITEPDYPRTLSLLATAYLENSEAQDENLRYALQLATKAAQNSAWISSRELKLLAKIYYKFGDKISALLLASKAQDINFRRSDVTYSSKEIDQFIINLTSGTLA